MSFMKNFLIPILLLSKFGYANSMNFNREESICGANDDRVLSFDPKVGRIVRLDGLGTGCTITMIGKSCAISAGHCTDQLGITYFNTTPSKNYIPQIPNEKNHYAIIQSSLEYNYHSIDPTGTDWAVMRLDKNLVTGLYPGEAQGYYGVSFSIPNKGDAIRLTGYGSSRNPKLDKAQQVSFGLISRISGIELYHKADTTRGSSGAALILETSNEIVAIHGQGGCGYSDESEGNGATMIANNTQLKEAIKVCLEHESEKITQK